MVENTQPWTVCGGPCARTRDPKAIEVLKPKDIYGDVELEDGSALMPPISHICQKGMKPNSPNQARGESVESGYLFCFFPIFFWVLGQKSEFTVSLAKEILPNLQGFCGAPKN